MQRDQNTDFIKNYAKHLSDLISDLDFNSVKEVADLILTQAKKGKTLYIIGNGGSASTASHFAADLIHCGLIEHRPIIKAISLSDNIALITAIGNDKGFEYIFSRQLDRLASEGDIVMAISASGNSKNLIEAFKTAKSMGVITVALVGFDGGVMAPMADHLVHIKTAQGEYGLVEDTHLFLDHMITGYIGSVLKAEQSK